MFIRVCFLVIASVLASNSVAVAEVHKTALQKIQVEKLVDGLEQPWAIAFIDDSSWLVTEKQGSLRQVVNGKLLEQPVAGVPAVASGGQGGLLDVAVHPDFTSNRLIYLSYSASADGRSGTEVLRARLSDDQLTEAEVIFSAQPKQRGGRHFGSRLVFDGQGYLFISLGDRGERESSQNGDYHAGSIIRLHDDGRIPADNPFVKNPHIRDEIFSVGHRNVQGMVFDRTSNTLWAHEHGPKGGDELNRVVAGNNYGWPVITYGVNYGLGTAIGEGTEAPGYQQPATYWVPSIAPSGMSLIDSERFPEWRNNLIVGALKFRQLVRLTIKDDQVIDEERMLSNTYGRIRDVRQGPDGFIYFITDSKNGAIYRISPVDK